MGAHDSVRPPSYQTYDTPGQAPVTPANNRSDSLEFFDIIAENRNLHATVEALEEELDLSAQELEEAEQALAAAQAEVRAFKHAQSYPREADVYGMMLGKEEAGLTRQQMQERRAKE